MAETHDGELAAELGRLRRHKQRNVQEQATLRKLEILVLALACRRDPSFFPAAVSVVFKERGVDPASAVLTRLQRNLPGCVNAYRGQWLTRDRRFIDFDIDLHDDDLQVDVNAWVDVTQSTPVSAHERGQGPTWGHLCVAIMADLNAGTSGERA